MHLVSTINPLSKSEGNIPVAVFCYEGKRKFIRVSESYEGTIQLVNESFAIKPEDEIAQLSFVTSSLDVCKGNDVVVDASAYPLMWTVLDEIKVVVDEVAPGRGRRAHGKERERVQLLSPVRTPVAGPSRDANIEEVVAKNAPPPPTKATSDLDIGIAKAKGTNDELDELEAGRERDDNDDAYDALVEEAMDGFNAPEIERAVDGEAEEEDSRIRKKFKAPGTLPVVNTEFPRIKKETGPIPGSSSPREEPSSPKKGNTAQNEASEDPRFEITIIGLGPHSSAQFKTRGRHTVRKVLAAACKTFGIDLERAHLFLSMSVPDDDGVMQTHEFECPPDDTMALCGIDSNAKLFVKVDEDEVEEEDPDFGGSDFE